MRALVIDDARTMRRIVGRILVDLGYEVMEAGHGEEAISHMEAGFVPDLACVDWNMPVMDGLAYITAVRGMPQWRAGTRLEGERDRVAGVQSGADHPEQARQHRVGGRGVLGPRRRVVAGRCVGRGVGAHDGFR